jgi:pyruvate dehydrogenase E2 component (dihydrolipoamide acetyltransferase)
MEIPSSHAGVVAGVKVKVGDKVAKGSLIALLQGTVAGAAAPAAAAAARSRAGRRQPPAAAARQARPPQRRRRRARARTPPRPGGQLPHASPTIRRWRVNWACRWPR